MYKKKAVLVTGAAGGIGKAICKAFSNEGYKVIATDQYISKDVICDDFIQFDLGELIGSGSQLDNFKNSVYKNLTDSDLNVLINNAAIQILGVTEQITQDDWTNTLNINLTVPLLLTQSFLKQLEKNQGSVINIASVHASATKPNFVSYATSKAALIGLTNALAVDLGGRVRVNSISPAATATDMLLAGFKNNPDAYEKLQNMHPIGRIAEPVEVARVAVFLASDSASFITGSCFTVDGGISVRLHDPE